MFKSFINKYICFISSDEKRKNVKESIEIRIKCLSDKEFIQKYVDSYKRDKFQEDRKSVV